MRSISKLSNLVMYRRLFVDPITRMDALGLGVCHHPRESFYQLRSSLPMQCGPIAWGRGIASM